MQDKKPQPLELLVQERKSENKEEEEEEEAATELPNARTREIERSQIGNKCCCSLVAIRDCVAFSFFCKGCGFGKGVSRAKESEGDDEKACLWFVP
jgi:hypothetical protein